MSMSANRPVRTFLAISLLAAFLAGKPATAEVPPWDKQHAAKPPAGLPVTEAALQSLAGWDAFGLGTARVRNPVKDGSNFSGRLSVSGLGDDLMPDVVGFGTNGQQRVLALSYRGKALVSLLPALRQTALADMETPQLTVLLAPPGSAGSTVALPAALGFGNAPVPLQPGASVMAHATVRGQLLALCQSLGIPARELVLSGRIDPRTLAGVGLHDAALQTELINAIDLRLALTGLNLPRKPAFLTFGESALMLKGVGGNVAAGIVTSATVNVGTGVHFDRVTVNRDPIARQIAIDSTSATPGAAFIDLHVDNAKILSARFQGRIDEQFPTKDSFTVSGQYSVAGSAPRDYSAALSGDSPARYLVTAQTATKLSDLLHWQAPGMDALELQDVIFSNGVVLGDLKLKDIKFSVALFKTPGQGKYNAAFMTDETFSFPRLRSALKNLPLNDVELVKPTFVLTPSENAGRVTLPPVVAQRMGLLPGDVDLKPGVNLLARANLSGEPAALLGRVGQSPRNLSISGSFDPALLAGGKDEALSDALINATNLAVSVNQLMPARKPAYLALGNSVLVMRGVGGKMAWGISTSLTVGVDGRTMQFDTVTVNHDLAKGQLVITSADKPVNGDFLDLKIAGAAVQQVAFTGIIDDADSKRDNFALDGKYVVLGSTPRGFAATLSGVGSSAQYVVTIQTETSLAELLGWSAPGLDALRLSDVSFGNDYILGDLTLRQLKFKVVLFRGGGQKKYNGALLIESLDLSGLNANLHGTPLAELQLAKPALVLVPQENVGASVTLVKPVADHLGLAQADLLAGVNLISRADARGDLATLLRLSGLAAGGLQVTGSMDTSMLSGTDAPLSQAALDAMKLEALLPAAASPRRPAYLALGTSRLQIWGDSGKLAAAVRTSIDVNVGRGIHADPVIIRHDPVKRLVVMDGNGKAGTDFISFPLAGAAITQVAFHGVVDELNPTNDRYEIDGQYKLAGSTPRDFVAVLSGTSPAQYEITVQADTRLSDLMGWSAPGLDSVAFKQVVFGNGYALGNASIKNQAFTVVVFKGAAQVKSNAAFLSDDTFRLTNLAAALRGTPLDDIELARPGFVLVPPENAANAVMLPLAVSRHIGGPSVNLKKGLNVVANGNAYGDVAALLSALGIDTRNLPISGTIDPAILSSPQAAAIAQPFLDALDLSVPFDRLTLPGAARVTASKGRLAIKGLDRGINASVRATLTADLKSEHLVFDDVALGLLKAPSGTTVSVSGAYPGDWNHPMGIDWINVRAVKLNGSFGPTTTLVVVGTTDIGPVHNMMVSVDLATQAGGGRDVVVSVTGADVSLQDIPALSSIPHLGDLKFRNLLLSAGALGGTLRSVSMPVLNGLDAVAFALDGRWNVAALLGETDLSKLIALPAFARPTLGGLKLGKAALLFGQAEFRGRLDQLPRAAQIAFMDIFGTMDGILHIFTGLNLVSRLDPASLGRAITSFLPAGQKLVLQGGIGGVGGGTPSLALSAAIPDIALPSSFGFIKLPSNAGTALFVSLTQMEAHVGVGIETVLGLRLNKQTIDFDTIVSFELDSRGGTVVELQGKSLNPWRNPMGINGFTLDPGTRIQTKTAPAGVTLTFAGITHVGSRTADVVGSANIVGGVVDQGAFEAKFSELALSDLVALFGDAVAAAGGQPLTFDVPGATLRNVDMAFASPGMNVPEIGLANGGTRVAGDLWFLLRDKALCKAKAVMTDSSFAMTGDVADIKLGPVALTNSKLDMRTQSVPPQPPVFRISGDATIMSKRVAGEIDAGLAETALISAVDLGGLLNLDLHASFDTPANGLDAASLAAQDLALNARLKSDVAQWLSTDGKKAVSVVFDSVGGSIKKLVSDIETAQKTVDGLDQQIAKARDRAKAGAQTVDQQIVLAQNKVNALADRVNSLKNDISSERNAVRRCDYSRSICYWWNWKGHCTKHKDIPDVARDAECEAENARHLAAATAKEATLGSAEAAKAAADAVLDGLKKGDRSIDVASLDPEVVALEAARTTAAAVLLAAKTAGQGAELGLDQLKAGLSALDRVGDIFRLTGSNISGNFQKAVSGKPVVLGLDFDLAGKPQHMRLALSLTDPSYNAKQMDTLALLVAKSAIEGLPGASPALLGLLNDAFKARHDEADKEVELAANANGLE